MRVRLSFQNTTAAAAVIVICASTCGAASQYTVTRIPSFPNASIEGSYADAINGWGQVTGHASSPQASAPFIWTPHLPNGTSGVMTAIGDGPEGFHGGMGAGINASGYVVGHAFINDLQTHAFLWNPNVQNDTPGAMTDIGTLPNSTGSAARAMNDFGQIVGLSGPHAARRAFLWTPSTPDGTSGTMTNLGDFAGGANHSQAYAVNGRGQVVGYSGAEFGGAFLWNPTTPNGTAGTMINLGTLPGNEPDISQANDINASGQVVGYDSVGGKFHAFLWTPTTPNGASGSMIDLGVVDGADRSEAMGLNTHGHVVGVSSNRAFVRTADDGMIDLNARLDATGAGWTLQQANGINDAGQIVGYGLYDPDGAGPIAAATNGFLLTPIPEPTGLLMLSVASAALLRRRRV